MCDEEKPDLVEYSKEKSQKGKSLNLRVKDISEKVTPDKNNNKSSAHESPKVRKPYVPRMSTPVLGSSRPRPTPSPEKEGCFSTPKEEVDKVKSSKMQIQKASSNRPQTKPLKIGLKGENNINSHKIAKSQISAEVLPSSAANPFHIDLVIDKIFGYAKKKDLRACRLVCKKWNLNIIPRFREEFEIYVCAIDHSKPPPNNSRPKPPDCKFGKADHKTVDRFAKLMCTSMCIPFTKFRLDLNFQAKGTTLFFRVCGPLITHVTLENFTLEWDTIFEKGYECLLIENLKEMFKYSKNLECLCFKTSLYNTTKGLKLFDEPEANLPALKSLSFNGHYWPRQKFPTHIEELIAHFPNLVDVSFTSTPWDSTDGLSLLVSPDGASKIRNLTTDSYRIKRTFVDQVEKCGFKLKNLHITGSDLDDPVHMYRFIELQKDNLHEFNCHLDSSGAGPTGREPELPGMKNLKVLGVHLQNSRMFSMRCINKSFCEKYPNLERMTFYYGYQEMNLDFFGSQCCPKLKSMELDFYKLDLPGFQNMTEIYSASALTSLKLDTGRLSSPDMLKVIWTNLTQLVELELIFSRKNFNGDLDSCFTGISPENCMGIKGNIAYWNFMNTKGKKLGKRKKLAELTSELCVSPSIADLKSLYRLSLKFPGVGLTDITGYLGLFELENLKHIHIDFCEFSKNCCESLMNQLTLESWVFRGKNRWYTLQEGLLGPFGYGIWRTFGPNKDIVPPYVYPYKERENVNTMNSLLND